MGCLRSTITTLLYLFFFLLLSGIAYAAFGGWGIVMLLLLIMLAWLNNIYELAPRGQFWRTLGYRVGRWLRYTPTNWSISPATPPHRAAASGKPSLPAHVAAMRIDLHLVLASVYRALHNPDSLNAETDAGTAAQRLDEYIAALKNGFEAAQQLKLKVFDQTTCSETERRTLARGFASAINAMNRAYGAILLNLAAQPGDNHLFRLERNARANLERLAMWLADLQMTIAHPGRILLEGEALDGNSRQMQFILHQPYPEDLAELNTWLDTPTGYDAGHVRAVLNGERGAVDASPPGVQPTAAPAPCRKSSGGWLVPLAIGWIIGDWLFDDDESDGA
jgi:hypothetical protein